MFIKTKARDLLELPEGIPLARRRHCSCAKQAMGGYFRAGRQLAL